MQESEREAVIVEEEETAALDSCDSSSSSDDRMNSGSDSEGDEDVLGEVQQFPDESETHKVFETIEDSTSSETARTFGKAEPNLRRDLIELGSKPVEDQDSNRSNGLTTEVARVESRNEKPIHRASSVPTSLDQLPSDNLQKSSSLTDCLKETAIDQKGPLRIIKGNAVVEMTEKNSDRQSEKEQIPLNEEEVTTEFESEQILSACEVSKTEAESEEDILKTDADEPSSTTQTVVLRRRNVDNKLTPHLDVVVESGKVKRRSRNFEKGVFNVSSDSDSETANVLSHESEASVEPASIGIDLEPKGADEQDVASSPDKEDAEPGAVKRHTQAIELKYRESLKRNSLPVRKSTSSTSEDEPETDKENRNTQDVPAVERSRNASNEGSSNFVPLKEKKDRNQIPSADTTTDILKTLNEVENIGDVVQEIYEEMNKDPSGKDIVTIEGGDSMRDSGEMIDKEIVEKAEHDSETPRAGLVKRNTLLLEEKVKVILAQSEVTQKRRSVVETECETVVDQSVHTGPLTVGSDLNVVLVTDAKSSELEQSSTETDQEKATSGSVSGQPVELGLPEREMEAEEDWTEKPGLVKRHTLLIEERMKQSNEDLSTDLGEPKVGTSESQMPTTEEEVEKLASGTEKVSVASKETPVELQNQTEEHLQFGKVEKDVEVEETNTAIEPGYVRRHKLRLEGRSLSLPETVTMAESTFRSESVCEQYCADQLERKDQASSGTTVIRSSSFGQAMAHAVDTTSVVRVKRHTQVIEDVIREATERDSKKKSREELQASQSTETESTPGISVESTPKVVVVHRTPEERRTHRLKGVESKSHQAVLQALEQTHHNIDAEEDVTHTQWAQANVRQRTQILEEIIQERIGATEAFEQLLAQAFENQTKQRSAPVRRHESLPKSMKPFGRSTDPSIHVRKRSLSIEAGNERDENVSWTAPSKEQMKPGEEAIYSLPRNWKPSAIKGQGETVSETRSEVKGKRFIIEELTSGEVGDTQLTEKEKLTSVETRTLDKQ